MHQKILKTYPHLEELNDYALKVMYLIMKTYPSWASLAEVGEFDGEKFLQVKVSAPFEPSENDLFITTSDDDLTVHFDMFHAHFGRWYETPEEAFEQAKIFIDRICEEDFIVGIKIVNGRWAGSRGYTPSTWHEIETGPVADTRSRLRTHFVNWIKKMVNGQWARTKGTPNTWQEIEFGPVTYTRSWLGTYNRQFDQNES